MKKTLVISVDGLRADDFADLTIRLPHLRAAAKRGWNITRAQTIFPSVTWAIHPSVLAGSLPSGTGCFGNTLYDRSAGRLVSAYDPSSFLFDRDMKADNLFDAFARSGFRVGAVCWPLSQGASSVTCNIPEFYSQNDFDAYTTTAVKKDMIDAGLPFEQYAAWSASHSLNPLQDSLTRDICLKLLSENSVDVLFTHFLTIDSLQHDFGVRAPEARWAMEYVDGLVGSLLAEVPDWNIVIFSDHGHIPVSKTFNIDQWLAGLETGDAKYGDHVSAASNGGVCFLYNVSRAEALSLKEVLLTQEAVSAVWLSEDFPFLGLPVVDPSGRGLLPDLIFEASPDWYIANGGDSGISVGPSALKGMHGYHPSNPDMDGFMLFAGTSFSAGIAIESASLLDIAPTLNSINALNMKAMDGTDLALDGRMVP